MGHGIFHSTFYCTLKFSWVGYDLLLQIEVKTLSRRNDSTELDETEAGLPLITTVIQHLCDGNG